MAIYIRPADTRPDPTLIGWILLGPIKNKIGSGFYQKSGLKPGLGLSYFEITKKPLIYIIVNLNPPTSHFNLRLTRSISLSLKSTHKSTLSPTLNLTAHRLTLKYHHDAAQALCLSPLVPYPTVIVALFSIVPSPLDATISPCEPPSEVAPSLSLAQ